MSSAYCNSYSCTSDRLLNVIDTSEVRAKKPSLTLNLGTNGFKVTSEPPTMAEQAGK
ncbi:hypothetical protein J6590_077829 [Homalodisca vitripennis]|nr:hypothetical protein J6590_077829 [Homalodisca vitripennis]